MTFESVDYGNEDEAEQPIKPARCRCYMPTTATPPPVITAADQVRRNLRLSAKWARFGRLMVEQLLAEHDAAVERADTAERELAEVREQHQPGPSLHAWRRPDGRYVHGEQDWIRKSVKAHGGEHVTAETCSYVSEWKAADGG